MKRYLLFCGTQYYPNGGWEDFRNSYRSLREAEINADGDWWHIVDAATGQIVKEYSLEGGCREANQL
jgi:hypothetical protein